jgi:hypothetical protein
MPIWNVIDSRKKPYRFAKINVIVEASWHDNFVNNADQAPTQHHFGGELGPSYDEKEHITLTEAIQWANSFTGPVTLYLYDEDGGLYERKNENG